MVVTDFAAPKSALVRLLPSSFDSCVRSGDAEIDVAAAQEQHVAYWKLLEELGIDVEIREEDESLPDCCFVEDTAVVLDDWVLVTRPGAPTRVRETEDVEAFLHTKRREVCHMENPDATLDGGDVLRVGARLFVGRSSRTNDAGIARLSDVAARDGLTVVPVDVRGGLHLKSGVTLLDPGRVLYDDAALDIAALRREGIECIRVDGGEDANVLSLGRALVVPDAAPRTADRLVDLDYDVYVGDVSEIQKGDGALTCLSLRFPARGTWCA